MYRPVGQGMGGRLGKRIKMQYKVTLSIAINECDALVT